MIDVLFITFEFPPTNSGGSHRPYRFAKHLKEFNINPIVLTTEVNEDDKDSTIINDENFTIIRTKVDKNNKFHDFLRKQYFNILDPDKLRWEKYLIKEIKQITKKYNFKAIYVTAPPFSIAELGIKVSKILNIPLILDLRDHWSHWNVTPFASYIHYKLILKKEKEWLEYANAIVVTAKQVKYDFLHLHNIDLDKIHVIKNSYPTKINNIKDEIAIPKPTIKKPLIIGYVGSFYFSPYQREMMFNPWWKKRFYQWFQYSPRKEDWLYRTPYHFFKALKLFRENNPYLANLIKVEFIGKKPNWLIDMIDKFELKDIVELKGVKSHSESIKFQEKCDVLLGTSHKVINGKVYCIAGKTYEYIYMQKPILAFVKEGDQKDIFEESKQAIVCDSDKTIENVKILEEIVNNGITLYPNKSIIEHNYTGYTTKELSKVIHNLIKKEEI